MNITCTNCKETKSSDEFYSRGGGRYYSWCKKCNSINVLYRQRNLKKACVDFMGNRCEDCKGVFHPAVYDFHHLDPSKKDFSLSSKKSTTFNEEIMNELSKCVLLCSNCHRLRHTDY